MFVILFASAETVIHHDNYRIGVHPANKTLLTVNAVGPEVTQDKIKYNR